MKDVTYAIVRDSGRAYVDLITTDIGISIEDALIMESEDINNDIVNIIVYTD